MQAAEILDQLQAQGIRLAPGANGVIRARPRERLTDEIRELVRRHRQHLLVALYGVTLDEIAERMGDDTAKVLSDPGLLDAVAHSIRDRKMRERGERPPGFDVRGTCQHCGPVWLHDGYSEGAAVPCCLWCFNRLQGHPIPRPEASQIQQRERQ